MTPSIILIFRVLNALILPAQGFFFRAIPCAAPGRPPAAECVLAVHVGYKLR